MGKNLSVCVLLRVAEGARSASEDAAESHRRVARQFSIVKTAGVWRTRFSRGLTFSTNLINSSYSGI